MATIHFDYRWAFKTRGSKDSFLLGKYYWPDATANEPRIRTFRTRQEATANAPTIDAVVVKVTMGIQITERDGSHVMRHAAASGRP